MSRFLFCSILLLLAIEGYTQPTITSGKPYPHLGSSWSHFRRGNVIVMLKMLDKRVVLQRLNASTLTQERAQQYTDFPPGYEIERIAEIGNEAYVLYSVVSKPLTTLFARKIDIDRGEFVDAGQKIAEIPDEIANEINTSDTWDFSERGRFKVYISSSDNVAICYRIKPKSLNSADSYEVNGVWVYDSTLAEKWHGNIKMPYPERMIDIQQRKVDSKGNFHFLLTKFNDNSTLKKKGGLPNYSLEMLSYQSAVNPIVTPLDFKGKFIQSAILNEHDGKVMCSGYYNTGKSAPLFGSKTGPDNVAGIFTVTITGDGTHLPMIMHDIPIEIINEGESKSTQEKNLKKSEKEAVELPMLSLLFTKVMHDGSLIIAGEKYYAIYNQSGLQSANYDDGVVAKILPDGRLAWIKKLRKEQTGRGYRAKSYRYYGRSGDNLNFLFVDSKDNLDAKPGESLKAYHDAHPGKGMLILWQINDQTGEITKKPLVDMKNANGLEIHEFGLSRIIPLDEKSFIFEGELQTIDRLSAGSPEIKREVLVKVEMQN